MALSLTIVPSSSSVDMYGSPDQSSSYSTSGHVAISFRHPSSLFGRRRTARYQLQSLSLTFEGQSELFTLPTGYAAARLCTFTEELVRQPYELFDDGDGDTAWHVTYDLRLPGWLPPTDVFGDCDKAEPGTRYALHATAKICSLDDAGSWLSLCSPISFRSKTFEASPCPITLNRYAMAPTVEGTWPMTCYGVVALPLELQSSRQHGILMEIFEKLEVLISVPQRISTDESMFPLAIRIRAPRMSPEIAARFKIPEFFVSLDQCERYQSSLGSWAEQFPVAKHSTQSPHVPLRSYHPMRSLYEIGLCTTPENLTLQDTFTLLRDSHKTKYLLDGSKPIFSDLQSDAWFVMNTNVAFSCKSFEKGRWVGSRKIRPSGAGPFLDVKHTLQVSVWCVIEGTADIPEARERLQFTIPLDFVRTRAATPAAPERATEAAVIAMPPLIPYDLPVYSHLFHSNGDRKIDHLEPLPLYTSTPDELSPLLADEDLPKTPSAQ